MYKNFFKIIQIVLFCKAQRVLTKGTQVITMILGLFCSNFALGMSCPQVFISNIPVVTIQPGTVEYKKSHRVRLKLKSEFQLTKPIGRNDVSAALDYALKEYKVLSENPLEKDFVENSIKSFYNRALESDLVDTNAEGIPMRSYLSREFYLVSYISSQTGRDLYATPSLDSSERFHKVVIRVPGILEYFNSLNDNYLYALPTPAELTFATLSARQSGTTRASKPHMLITTESFHPYKSVFIDDRFLPNGSPSNAFYGGGIYVGNIIRNFWENEAKGYKLPFWLTLIRWKVDKKSDLLPEYQRPTLIKTDLETNPADRD